MCSKCVRAILVCSLGVSGIGCATKAQSGAVIGGAGGAAAGGLIGSTSHARAGEGALIGGAIGAIGGALIGHQMDKNDQPAQDHYASRDYDRRHGASSTADNRSAAVTKSDVIAWTHRGTSDEVIVDRIEHSGSIFHLNAADENDLRDNGVSETVIRAMQDTSRR